MKKLTDFPYTNILVLGLARSGTAAAELLLFSGKQVRVNDSQTLKTDEAVSQLESMGADVIVGSHPLSVLDNIELIVKNPGIPYDNIIVVEAEKRNIPIITEVELAGKLVDGSIIGITGSNGKTTTTMLVSEMLTRSKQAVKVAGNIGTAATSVAQQVKKDMTMVLELSSFQLLGIQTFKKKVAVLLNIYEAHLDYHKTLENYQQAKLNIFANQTAEDYLIYNAEDEDLVEAVKQAKALLIPFSKTEILPSGAWIDEKNIYFRNEKVVERDKILLVGNHNLENILAAICAAKISGATNKAICETLLTFSGVKHRLQLVEEKQGRLFYNDSKATNILATQKALASFTQPIVLLAGGLDRGNEFTDLLPYLKHVKAMVLFGETKEKLKELANMAQIKQVRLVEDINEAVLEAYSLSDSGDVILLSPACASWDQYKTFEERGDMFINQVHTLA